MTRETLNCAVTPAELLATIRVTVGKWAIAYREWSGHNVDPAYRSSLANDIAFELGVLEAVGVGDESAGPEGNRPNPLIGKGEVVQAEEIERVAEALAKADGLDWNETCALECPHTPGVDSCDSSTCVAALDEDHDPDDARAYYRKRATAAIAALRDHRLTAQPNGEGAVRSALEDVLNTSGARGTYHALKYSEAVERAEGLLARVESNAPIPMLLYCPKCGLQHIDAPDDRTPDWTNPPHRSHLCHGCGCIWRPADVATDGVKALETRGKADTWEPSQPVTVASPGLPARITSLDMLDGYEAGLAEGRREVEQVVDKLIGYTEHDSHCDANTYINGLPCECNCGMTAAVNEARGDYRPTTEGESGDASR